MIDAAALRRAFHISNTIASQHAIWCADDPGADRNLCRYCGKPWRKWANSKLDGHAACIVTKDFKKQLKEILSPSTVTYRQVAEAIGVSESVVRSWTFPIKGSRR